MLPTSNYAMSVGRRSALLRAAGLLDLRIPTTVCSRSILLEHGRRNMWNSQRRWMHNQQRQFPTNVGVTTMRRSSSKQGGRKHTPVTLKSSRSHIDSLLNRIRKNGHSLSHDQGLLLLEEANNILQSVIAAVDKGDLNPLGKHGKGISNIISGVMQAYDEISAQSVSMEIPCYNLSQEALDTLSRWNLNFQSAHYEHAISVANREGKWKEASNLFFKQIDPGAGYNPVHVSIADPQGLYAIARYAQEQQSPVAELVFDAVLQLSMVSPQDQSHYILAAGTALGKAGEWGSAIEFLNNSYTAKQLGQSLIPSVMQACLLSGNPEEAIKVCENNMDVFGEKSIAEEWQWGGERDTFDPITRDLVMRAAWIRGGDSTLVLDLFYNSVQEGFTISEDALLGVLTACESDSNIEGSLSILDCILENAAADNWIVPATSLAICDRESENAALSGGQASSQWFGKMSEHLASVIRICNKSAKFGTGLFYLRRFDVLMEDIQQSHLIPGAIDGGIAYSISSMLSKMRDEDPLVVPIVVALCGLRCYDEALWLSRSKPVASILEEFIKLEIAKNGLMSIGNAWVSADRHIHRLSAALAVIRRSDQNLGKRDVDQICKALAFTMRSCTNAHQADLSLRLLLYTANVLGCRQISDVKAIWTDLGVKNDELTAEIMDALGWTDGLSDAGQLFEFLLEKESSNLSNWRSACSAGLATFVKLGRGEEAVGIFNQLDKATLTPKCYCEIGRYLIRTGKTNELADLYSAALETGNLSEELSLMTMATVAESNMDNRVRVLRTIVADNAKFCHVSREEWTKTRYWHLKKALGFYYARLLMWWNDVETCHLDELDFAIKELEIRKKEDLKARNDALRVIANSARVFNDNTLPQDTSRWSHLPRSKEEWTELLLRIIADCRSSSLYYDARFVDSIVAAFIALGSHQECVDYIAAALNNGVRVQAKTLSRALEPASKSQSFQLVNDIKMLISDQQKPLESSKQL